ncbi:MAG: hypothetical protein PHR60_05055 [Eubacteriales bacterium]|nr:hypothetical protein [Eubacteriales bacterium]
MIGYLLLAPLLGGLLTGLEGWLKARLQGRRRSSILQPFQDIILLFKMSPIQARGKFTFYAVGFFIGVALSGGLFFGGESITLVILLWAVAGFINILALYNSQSSYSKYALEKEAIWIGIHLTIFMFTAIGLFLVTAHNTGEGSFHVYYILSQGYVPACQLPGILIGFIALLVLAPRRCFLEHTVAAEYSGRNLAFFEVGRWYENILLFGFVFILHYGGTVLTAVISVIVCLLIFLLRLLLASPLSKKYEATFYYVIGLVSLIMIFINLVVLVK